MSTATLVVAPTGSGRAVWLREWIGTAVQGGLSVTVVDAYRGCDYVTLQPRVAISVRSAESVNLALDSWLERGARPVDALVVDFADHGGGGPEMQQRLMGQRPPALVLAIRNLDDLHVPLDAFDRRVVLLRREEALDVDLAERLFGPLKSAAQRSLARLDASRHGRVLTTDGVCVDGSYMDRAAALTLGDLSPTGGVA